MTDSSTTRADGNTPDPPVPVGGGDVGDDGGGGDGGGGSPSRPGGITGLAARGTVIKIGSTFLLKFLTIVQTYFFVRWFSPQDFGFFQVATLTASVVLLFSKAGLSQAILRGEGDQRRVMDVALTLNLVIGVVFCVFILLTGLVFGALTGGELQGFYVMLMAYSAFSAAAWLPAVLWQRHFKFHWDVVPQFITILVGFLVTWLLWRSEYFHPIKEDGEIIPIKAGCLIFGGMAGFFAAHAFIWLFAPYRPKPRWDPAIVKDLYSFGWPLFFSSIFAFIAWSGDDFLVYLYRDQDELGLYGRAFFIPMFLASLQDMVCHVLLPALKNAKSRASLEYGFTIANKYMGILAAFGGLWLFAYARPFTSYYLGGGEWGPVEGMIQIFAFSFFFRTVSGWGWWILPMLHGNNKPIMWANLTYAIGLLTVGQVLIWQYGGVGGALTNLFVVLCLVPFFRLGVIRKEFGSIRCLYAVWPAVVAGGLMCAVSRLWLAPWVVNNYYLLAATCASGLLFAAAYLACDRGEIIRELKGFMRHGLNPGEFIPEER